jgi:hypothetical protein
LQEPPPRDEPRDRPRTKPPHRQCREAFAFNSEVDRQRVLRFVALLRDDDNPRRARAAIALGLKAASMPDFTLGHEVVA